MASKVKWIVIPVLNPDGYVYTWTRDRMWRKNRNPRAGRFGRRGCVGVDLNRNYDIEWGRNGISRNPCSDIYPGKKAFSEPESKAHSDLLKSLPNKGEHTKILYSIF